MPKLNLEMANRLVGNSFHSLPIAMQKEAIAEIIHLRNTVQDMRTTLEFYADPDMWTQDRAALAPMIFDEGKMARETLERNP